SKQSNFESLMTKIAPSNAMVSLADSVVIDLSSHYKDSLSEKIEIFKQAIAEHKTVRFDYYYTKGEVPREIEPYFVEFRWNAWYVFGWCRLREDFRRFKLNRLWALTLTDESYKLRTIPPGKADAGYAFPEPYNMKILFDRSVRFRLIEECGLNCYTDTEAGLLLNFNYTNKDYTLSWILGFGDKAEILEPQDVREEFASMTKKIFELYN
ncbi:MAG: WYL domain-containing protein, partial [Eubacteriales bacterium]|nr:WYL domain-containing protein [Eubacteriales bacterium]